MTAKAEDIAAVFSAALEHLKDGAFGVSIRNLPDGVLIERVDPLLNVSEVAEIIRFTPATVREMARKGLLHPIKSKGFGGSLRFRKSRLVADMKRMEDL